MLSTMSIRKKSRNVGASFETRSAASLLRIRLFLSAIDLFPHAEEHPKRASRSTGPTR
jgi:hypothetical protein